MALEHLFDAELQYQPGMAPLADEGEGVLVGSGDGTLAGPSLAGTLRWTLFEQPGELVCAMSPTLRIETSNGAQIRADGRGFAARDRAEASEWRAAATLATPGWTACSDSGRASSTRSDTAPATAPTSNATTTRKEPE